MDESVLAPVRGLPVRQAAARLGVSPAPAHRWLSQFVLAGLVVAFIIGKLFVR